MSALLVSPENTVGQELRNAWIASLESTVILRALAYALLARLENIVMSPPRILALSARLEGTVLSGLPDANLVPSGGLKILRDNPNEKIIITETMNEAAELSVKGNR